MNNPRPLSDVALRPTGAIDEPDPTDPGTITRYVYQQTTPQFANLRIPESPNWQKRLWVPTPNPNTPAQITARNRFRNAVEHWQALTPLQKAELAPSAKFARLPAYQYAIKLYLAANPMPGPVVWDRTPSVWDAAASTWDPDNYTNWDINPSLWDAGTTNWEE
jgi:hypothetical protein